MSLDDKVIVNNRLQDYNWIKHEMITNRRVKIVHDGEVVVMAIPVCRIRSKKEVATMLLQGLIGAIGFYILLVLMIGLAPMH